MNDTNLALNKEFRSVCIERYGTVYVRRDGRCVVGKKGNPLSLHWRNQDGYVQVKLSFVENGKRKTIRRLVHRLVAIAFVENPNNYLEVNHIDGNKENNNADNLEWCTRKHNVIHAWEHGLCGTKRGEHNGRAIITETIAFDIRQKYLEGKTIASIARYYGIGWSTVYHVLKGDTWAS